MVIGAIGVRMIPKYLKTLRHRKPIPPCLTEWAKCPDIIIASDLSAFIYILKVVARFVLPSPVRRKFVRTHGLYFRVFKSSSWEQCSVLLWMALMCDVDCQLNKSVTC